MTLSVTPLIRDIQFVIGDVSDQFSTLSTTSSNITLYIENELADTVRWLTTNNIFYWNVGHTAGVTHTSGNISLTASTAAGFISENVASIMAITDSLGNTNYTNVPYEEYYQRTDVATSAVTYNNTARIGFIIATDASTGADQIRLVSGTNTPSDLTLNVVYSRFTEAVTSGSDLVPWIPNRIRPFLISFTAAKMLSKMDSPDKNLLQIHVGLAQQALKAEEDFGQNRNLTKFNQNGLMSQNLIPNLRSKYTL